MPGLRRVRPPARRHDLVSRVPVRVQERRRNAATIDLAGRVTASRSRLEESPDTEGQDAGETPGGESRRKVAQKGDRQRRQSNSAKASLAMPLGVARALPA